MAACEALAAAPAAVDTGSRCSRPRPRFGTGAPAGDRAARHVRPGDAAAGAADAPPDALGAGAAAFQAPRARGPPRQRRGGDGSVSPTVARLALAAALAAARAGRPRAARATATISSEGRRRGRASGLVLSVGPEARRQPWPRRTGTR